VLYFRKQTVQALARLRCSNHDLIIEKGRHLKVPRKEIFYIYCKVNGLTIIETEHHFVMECGLYTNIRKDLINNFICGVNNFDIWLSI
jgi:hypothetical protein